MVSIYYTIDNSLGFDNMLSFSYCLICVDQAVLETVARVKPKKNDTKDEKYLFLALHEYFKYLFQFVELGVWYGAFTV